MDQPRVPSGNPKGGQFAHSTTGGQWSGTQQGVAQPTASVVRSTVMRPGGQIHKEKTELAKVAQSVYDAWKQDADGMDEELGAGGICQDIADEMASHLNSVGLEAVPVAAEIGEQHVWVVARAKDGVFLVDIPPGTYETGGGYNWRKREGVVFGPEDLIVDQLSPSPKDFWKFSGADGDQD